MTDQRPAQQSPDWDPTLADPLYVSEEVRARFERRYRWNGTRFFGFIAFAALVVVLAIISAALLVAAPR